MLYKVKTAIHCYSVIQRGIKSVFSTLIKYLTDGARLASLGTSFHRLKIAAEKKTPTLAF